jgi:hypothetical protein
MATKEAPAPEYLVYVVTEDILLNDPDGNCRIHAAGSEIKYAGLPSANMLPTCEKGRAKRAEAIAYDEKGRFASMANIENIGSKEREAAASAVEKAKAKAKALAREKKEDAEDLA